MQKVGDKTWQIISLADGSRAANQIAQEVGCSAHDVRVACARHNMPLVDDGHDRPGGVQCPACKGTSSSVLDSRPANSPFGLKYLSSSVRRRRVCMSCASRFTTYEIQEGDLSALLETFSRRSVAESLHEMAFSIERELNKEGLPNDKRLSSRVAGRLASDPVSQTEGRNEVPDDVF